MGFCANTFVTGIFIIAICSDFAQGAPPSKIVGGHSAIITDWPAIVSIQYNNEHFCGGTLITKCHVLTAAHCVVGVNGMLMKVNTGSSDQAQMRNSYAIARFDVHPGYRGEQTMYHNDIAIITLRQCITVNAYERVANIFPSYLGDGAPATVAGWGQLSYNIRKTNRFLQHVGTTVISNSQCLNTYPATTIRPEQLCAMSGVGHGFCSGDSGGPLIVQNQVAGVVSLASKCGVGMPDVYTRVSPYLPWMHSITGS